ncbi:MAG: hypothetical protein JKY98_10350 [Gammaproteobacteria bacterium]|nr:hypothetical protein [Gammaproteobacteria bacterium]
MNKLILSGLGSIILFAPVLCWSQTVTGEIVELPGYSFKYSLETSARRSTIWQLWSDVENWKKFDTLLEYSYLDDDTSFVTGATGVLNAEGAPEVKFEIMNVIEPESFTVRLHLPLYQTIDQQRYFEVSDSGVATFSHEISFKGGLKSIMCFLLCGTYKKETQRVMERLKVLAEAQ